MYVGTRKTRGLELGAKTSGTREMLLIADETREGQIWSQSVHQPVSIEVKARSRSSETQAAGTEDAPNLAQARSRVGQVPENLNRQNDVERSVGKGQNLNVRLTDVGVRIQRASVVEHFRGAINAGALITAATEVGQVVPGAAANVEDARAATVSREVTVEERLESATAVGEARSKVVGHVGCCVSGSE
jgi:hypothetical protein